MPRSAGAASIAPGPPTSFYASLILAPVSLITSVACFVTLSSDGRPPALLGLASLVVGMLTIASTSILLAENEEDFVFIPVGGLVTGVTSFILGVAVFASGSRTSSRHRDPHATPNAAVLSW